MTFLINSKYVVKIVFHHSFKACLYQHCSYVIVCIHVFIIDYCLYCLLFVVPLVLLFSFYFTFILLQVRIKVSKGQSSHSL